MAIGPALQHAATPEALDQVLGTVGPAKAGCATWGTFAWTRWVVLFGADSAALDLPAIDRLTVRAGDLGSDPDVLQWSRALLDAARTDGRDLEEAKKLLGTVSSANPDALWPKLDLAVNVALPLGDHALAAEQVQQVLQGTARTPEDRGAQRLASSDGVRARRGAGGATGSATERLPAALLGQTLLQAALLARLEVEAVLLDVLADPLPLDLPAEATQGLLERLVLTHGDQDQGGSSSFCSR
jgi:hypothetical protein